MEKIRKPFNMGFNGPRATPETKKNFKKGSYKLPVADPLPTSAIETDIYCRGLLADVSQEELERIWEQENNYFDYV